MDLQGAGITVFCGSSSGVNPAFLATAAELGTALAGCGARVVYGGASVGLMGALASAALAAGGEVVGVIPQQLVDKELAHKKVTTLLVVPSMHERKMLMSRHAAGYVVMPGGYGTWEEFFEVVTWKQLGLHTKPIILLNLLGYYDPLLAQIKMAVGEDFMRPAQGDYILVANTVPHAVELLKTYAQPALPVAKWT